MSYKQNSRSQMTILDDELIMHDWNVMVPEALLQEHRLIDQYSWCTNHPDMTKNINNTKTLITE